MPIPTDTFWNIKRLNVVFAISGVLLFAVTAWAIFQDHFTGWRIPQQQAKVWEAALVDDRIQRELTPAEKQHIDELQKEIADREKDLQTHNQTYDHLIEERKSILSDRATLEFQLNNVKSNVQVMESNLQDAIAANETEHADSLRARLAVPHKQLAEWSEKLAQMANRLTEIRDKMDAETAQVDSLKKEQTALTMDLEALKKRRDALLPESLPAKLSAVVRDMPLMGFMNPSEKVQQTVLPDVLTEMPPLRVPTVDRCTTCHINIAKKDFAEDKIVAYLEEQVATARKYHLPVTQTATGATAPSATAAKPGPVAAIEFWHSWGMKAAPAQVAKFATRLNTILRSATGTGPAKVVYDGQPVTAAITFSTTAPSNSELSEKQNDVLLALFEAYYRWSPEEDGVGKHGKAEATVSKSAGTAVNTPRNFSMRYAEDIRSGLQQTVAAETLREINVRYRYALVDEANLARHKQGLPALDASGALLAHPRLDLYVDIDSPHSSEAVGCTSCHDGSGQETDFVVAAHTPRDIFVDSRTGVPVLPTQFKDPKIAESEHAEKHDLSSMLAAAFPENLSQMKQIGDLHFEKPATQPSAEGEESHSAGSPVDYVDPATGKEGQAIKQMAYWIKVYEPKAPRPFSLVYHEWDWPMRTPEYIQTNCARCHTDVYDIKDTAPVLYEGRQLFTQMGCVNCHQMDSIPSYENRKVGTDLRHVTSKLSKDYINTWIWAPKAFRPSTKMPHFFMLENNSSDEEIRRTRQEARAITEYLARTATPLPPTHVYPSSGQGKAEDGKAVFESIGCMACHQNLNERGEEWITTDLQKRAGMPEADAKTAYAAMGYNERQMYVQQYLAEPFGHNTKANYADGTPKPVFVQVGPELSAIGTKLTAGRTPEQARAWLFDWVMEPRHYSDYTIMPRLRLTEQQAMDVAEYLLSQTRKKNDPKDVWSAGLTDPDTNKLIELTSLQLRSRYSVATSMVKADDDTELTALATAALTTPVTPFDKAKTEVAGMKKDEKRMVFLGQKLIAHYGCMSCHAINGMETTSSPCANLSDWGQKSVDKLDYGYLDHHHVEEFLKDGVTSKSIPIVNGLSPEAGALGHESIQGKPIAQDIDVTWPEIEHTRNSWITQKLKNTRIYDRGRALLEPSADSTGKPYDKLKMPTFYLNDDQVHAIVTFVISNRDRLISEKLTLKAINEQARKIAHGRELTERYNCVACHQIEKNVPQIQQYYKADEINTKAPPSLRGEGNKIQYAWLFNFFKNVEQMRPLLFQGIHMPSFPATDEEWSSIIAYFNSVSNKESKQLAKDIDPVVKYVDFQRKSTTRPAEADAQWPGDDWFKKPEFARTTDALKDWGLTYGHIKPIEIGPTASASDLNVAYRMLLFKARFTTDLYAAPFPFVDSPRPQITQERFELGQKFFYEMQCLKCHVLGDPNVAGANKTPTAPNLSMAATRLQQRWVRHWVQEPYIIQINTAMPPFFSGWKDKDDKIIASLEGQSWPRALKTDRAPEVIEAEYGKTVDEQMRLLLDFLYAAGARGFTGVQPASTTQPAASLAPATQPTAMLRDERLLNPYIYTDN